MNFKETAQQIIITIDKDAFDPKIPFIGYLEEVTVTARSIAKDGEKKINDVLVLNTTKNTAEVVRSGPVVI